MTKLISPDEDLKGITCKEEEWIPKWKDCAEYDYLTDASTSEEYAWEFLRRNKDYQIYCDVLSCSLKTYRPMKAKEKVNRVYVGPSHTTKTKADWHTVFPKHYSERFFEETATAKQSPLFCAQSVEVLADMTDSTRPGISERLKYRSIEWDEAEALFIHEQGLDFQMNLVKGQLAVSFDLNSTSGNTKLFDDHLEAAVKLVKRKYIQYQKNLKSPEEKSSKLQLHRLVKLLRISDGFTAGASRKEIGLKLKVDSPRGFGIGEVIDIHRSMTKYVAELRMLTYRKGYLNLLA